MGANSSSLLQVDSSHQSPLERSDEACPYLCVTIKECWTKVKVVNAGQNTVNLILDFLHRQSRAIGDFSSEWEGENAFVIRLRAPIWNEAYHLLMCSLVENLYAVRLNLLTGTVLSRNSAVTTLFFERSNLPAITSVCCLSLKGRNKMNLSNAPQSLEEFLVETARICFVKGVERITSGVKELSVRLNGNVWKEVGFVDGICARRLLLDVVRAFATKGYAPVATANPTDNESTLFFKHQNTTVDENEKYAMLCLTGRDRLRLIDPTDIIIDTVGTCIVRHWPDGIKDETRYRTRIKTVDFELAGDPWWRSKESEIPVLFLTIALLRNLKLKGWTVLLGSDLLRRIDDKASFILRSCPRTETCAISCLSFAPPDKIRLVNVSNDLLNALDVVVQDGWKKGVVRAGNMACATGTRLCYQWILNGTPFVETGASFSVDYLMARGLLCHILKVFQDFGWKFLCSVDTATKYAYDSEFGRFPTNVHSWFFEFVGLPENGVLEPPNYGDLNPLTNNTNHEGLPSYEEAIILQSNTEQRI